MAILFGFLCLVLLVSIALVLSFEKAERNSETIKDAYNRLLAINADLQQELIRTGAHRDELLARYHDQEVDREIKEANQAMRSEKARKASQARWAKRAA